MLALTRKQNERVFIILPDGRQVVVSIVEIADRGKVRLGFAAPNDIAINREEVHEAIEAAKATKRNTGMLPQPQREDDEPRDEDSTPLELPAVVAGQ